mmetsp:Transcript_9779/g.41063  ORF Transcript_9779/g.41063 Transcript_9779/m.41063 type:complete len:247 (-) Transcript_9779:1373-2113(-)
MDGYTIDFTSIRASLHPNTHTLRTLCHTRYMRALRSPSSPPAPTQTYSRETSRPRTRSSSAHFAMPTRTLMLAHGFEVEPRAPDVSFFAVFEPFGTHKEIGSGKCSMVCAQCVWRSCGDVLSTPGVSALNRSEKSVSNQSTMPCTVTGPPASTSTTTERCVSPVAPSPAPAVTLASTSSPRTPSVRAVKTTSRAVKSSSLAVTLARSSRLISAESVTTCAPLTGATIAVFTASSDRLFCTQGISKP